MEHLPTYIKIVFVLTTLITILMLFRASKNSKPLIAIILGWLVLQSAISLSGFYTLTSGMPPRFGLLLFPPLIFIAGTFLSAKGKRFIDTLDVKILTLLHIVRIPVELTLYGLFLQKMVPGIMTFEGRNFDILCGLSAPLIYYFGYVKNVFGRKMLIAWNIICLGLLNNIVIMAVLSAPLPMQKFAFDQPNIAILYFPFTLLPGLIVPIVLFAHLTSLRSLFFNKRNSKA